MKITYGNERRNGKRVFTVHHKFAKGITEDDQATMIIKQIIKKCPDAGEFEFFRRVDGSGLCGGRFKVKV